MDSDGHEYKNHVFPPNEAATIDSQVATDSECPKCGSHCYYDSHFEKTKTGYIYRAFSICSSCGYEIEF